MSARDHALAALDECHLPGWPAHVLRRGRLRELTDPRDRALAEQITAGVIKNLFHLEFLAQHFSGRKPYQIEPLVFKILAIGLYQIRFLDRVPQHAAVNEAVEQARRLGAGRASGFVNAVLRKAAGGQWPELPDPAVDPAGYARFALSHPPELFRHIEAIAGTERALEICRRNNQEPPTIIRVNAGRSLEEIDLGGIAVRPHESPGMFVLDAPPLRVLVEIAEQGIGQVQDPTAAAVVPMLDLHDSETVLDRCSGVGTKTIQIAQAVGPAGKVVAMDTAQARCRTLQHLIDTRHVGNITVICAGTIAGLPADVPREYEAILVDAPCSNSGVLARRPEARYHQTESAMQSLGRLQDKILDDSAGSVKPGGRMLYSTCSIWPQENQHRVERFLQIHGDYRLLSERAVLPSVEDEPSAYHDGGYCALLGRR